MRDRLTVCTYILCGGIVQILSYKPSEYIGFGWYDQPLTAKGGHLFNNKIDLDLE